MPLLYPKKMDNNSYGELVGELTALGGVEHVDFFFTHDALSNQAAEVTEELYEAWRNSTPLLSDTEAEADANAAAARAAGDTEVPASPDAPDGDTASGDFAAVAGETDASTDPASTAGKSSRARK